MLTLSMATIIKFMTIDYITFLLQMDKMTVKFGHCLLGHLKYVETFNSNC